MSPALYARVAGVVADYQGDPRGEVFRKFWPELAESLDELIDMWNRTEGTEKK